MVITAKGAIRTLEQLMEAAQVDLEKWDVRQWKANTWNQALGEGRIGQMFQVTAHLERSLVRELRSAIPIRAIPREKPQLTVRKRRTTLLIPDSQNGCWWSRRRDQLYPLHDRRAWDIAIQLAALLQPEVIVLLGDMLDLAPWSRKYVREPRFRYTTQPSVDEMHWWLSQLRLASRSSRIIYLEGNHEHRIRELLATEVSEIHELRRAKGNRELVSIPSLLALDSLDVEFMGPYDASLWLWDKVLVHHGETASKGGGSTVAKLLKDTAAHSQVVGHVHRREIAWRTLHEPSGEREVFAMSPGTIARIDNVVPAAISRVDWQQGLAVLDLEEGLVDPELIPIANGRCRFRGYTLHGKDRSKEIADATRWPFTSRETPCENSSLAS